MDVGATTSRASAEGTDVLANEWTHVAVTWDASDPVMRQYKNGAEIDSVNKTGSVVEASEGVQMGVGNKHPSGPWCGNRRGGMGLDLCALRL